MVATRFVGWMLVVMAFAVRPSVAIADPCTEETLATVADANARVVLPEQPPVALDLMFHDCWDCGGPTETLPAFFVALFLFPVVLAVNRHRRRSEALIVPRFDLLGGVASSRPASIIGK